MLVIDNGDAIRGIAEVASKLDFTVHGYVGTTPTQLTDGQLGASEADLYASGADGTVVTTITITNTDSAARTFTLYLKPSGGTSRAISPVSLDLGINHTFYTDGQRMVVMDASGQVLSTWAVDDTPVDGETDKPISSNWAYDHNAVDTGVHGAGGDVLATDADITADITTHAADFGLHTKVIRKADDEIINDSDTLQNDDELLFAMGANEVWHVFVQPLPMSVSDTPDMKVGFSVPSGCAFVGVITVISAVAGTSTTRIDSATPTNNPIAVWATTVLRSAPMWDLIVINGATAGNFQVQWAQNTKTAEDTTMKANSCLIATRLA